MPDPRLVAQSFRVEGRVQGVSYRAAAQRKASELGLVGWVRNTADGAVEGIACGDPDLLTDFMDWLWRGPRLAKVIAVSCAEVAPVEDSSFAIKP